LKVTIIFYIDHSDYSHVFAIGDITNIPEFKMAAWTAGHVATVKQNIQLLEKNPTKPLKEYKPAAPGMAVTLGKTGGQGQFKGMLMGDFMLKTIKGKNLFTPQTWKAHNLTMPK
jgi:apoptosis-inducing factor 2